MISASFWTWNGWNALVAIGTLALAGATGLLALITKRAVEQSRRQIDLSAREVTAVEKQTDALTKQIDLSAQEVEAVQAQTEMLLEQTNALREQADATKRQVAISSASLEAAARPVLVGIAPSPATSGQREDVPYTAGFTVNVEVERIHYEATADMIFCSVPLRNVGAGVAFVQRVTIQRGYREGRVSHAVVPPGALTRARFALARKGSDGRPTDINEITKEGRGIAQFTIYVVYTAASRDLVTGTEVNVSELPDETFLVTGNEIYDGDTGTRTLLASTANVG
jgi:hypothetical protein